MRKLPSLLLYRFLLLPSCATHKKYRLLRRLSFAYRSFRPGGLGISQVCFRPDLHDSYLLLRSGDSHRLCNNRFPYPHCSRKYKEWSHIFLVLPHNSLSADLLTPEYGKTGWRSLLLYLRKKNDPAQKATLANLDAEERSPGSPSAPIPRLYAFSRSWSEKWFSGCFGERCI